MHYSGYDWGEMKILSKTHHTGIEIKLIFIRLNRLNVFHNMTDASKRFAKLLFKCVKGASGLTRMKLMY